jgi:hypothetical protein
VARRSSLPGLRPALGYTVVYLFRSLRQARVFGHGRADG